MADAVIMSWDGGTVTIRTAPPVPEPVVPPPARDIPLMRKAVEWTETQAAMDDVKSEWYQSAYVVEGQAMGRECKTAYCVAGYTAIVLAGYEPVSVDCLDVVTVEDGRRMHVADVAQRVLGLTSGEATELFAGGNDAARIRELAESYAGERL